MVVGKKDICGKFAPRFIFNDLTVAESVLNNIEMYHDLKITEDELMGYYFGIWDNSRIFYNDMSQLETYPLWKINKMLKEN